MQRTRYAEFHQHRLGYRLRPAPAGQCTATGLRSGLPRCLWEHVAADVVYLYYTDDGCCTQEKEE